MLYFSLVQSQTDVKDLADSYVNQTTSNWIPYAEVFLLLLACAALLAKFTR